MHADCIARLKAGNPLLQLGYQWRQVLKPFAGGTQDCDGVVELPERLLFGKIVVHRDQNVEVFLCRHAARSRSSVPSSRDIPPFRPRLSGSST